MPKKTIVRVRKKKEPPRGITSTGRPRKKSKESAEKRERRLQAMELRASGVTYGDIAKQLGYYDHSAARKDVQKGLDKVEMDVAKHVVVQDIQLLDEFKMRSLHKLRTEGDLSQTERILRLMEFKYRLIGLTDETVRQLQGDYGITGNVTTNNNTIIVGAAPETEQEFIQKMMKAVGVNPDSPEAKEFMRQKKLEEKRALPMLEGSANESVDMSNADLLDEGEIVDAEIIED